MGEVFAGRYELVDVLGHGGMGDVWRVWDRRDTTYRAAKLLRQSDSAALLRFVRETSWRVEHPHVVMPAGWAGDDDRVLFTMPIVTGGSLATVLADHGTVPWSWAQPVLEQVAGALEAVHAAGLIHRDVKPANILLEPTGTGAPYSQLSDFGIAVHVDDPRLTTADDVIGTRGYQAPEVAAGADPEPAHDLYALGVLAREMLGAVVDGSDLARLVDPDPVSRPSTAGEALAVIRSTSLPDAGSEAVEVFEHVPPLPAGWGPDGRRDERRRVPRDAVAALGLTVLGVALIIGAVLLV